MTKLNMGSIGPVAVATPRSWDAPRSAPCPPNSPYGNDRPTAPGRMDQLAHQRAAIITLLNRSNHCSPAMSNQDRLSYEERGKLFGQEAAARWVIAKCGKLITQPDGDMTTARERS